jgi:hypothetical protein
MKLNLILMSDQDKFINHINDHYTELKWKYFKFCNEHQYPWDEDIYSDTIVKCYDTIVKKGKLSDTTPQGIENYFFKAFKNNIMNEKNYCRTKYRDWNINSDNINDIYEDWYNNNNISEHTKLVSDLWKDFATLYIMTMVEQNFDSEHFYLYRMKTLVPNMTFKKLAQECKHIKATRRKVLEVMHWVKDNITKEDIRKVFYTLYGDIV